MRALELLAANPKGDLRILREAIALVASAVGELRAAIKRHHPVEQMIESDE
jgi:hypothetical protein